MMVFLIPLGFGIAFASEYVMFYVLLAIPMFLIFTMWFVSGPEYAVSNSGILTYQPLTNPGGKDGITNTLPYTYFNKMVIDKKPDKNISTLQFYNSSDIKVLQIVIKDHESMIREILHFHPNLKVEHRFRE